MIYICECLHSVFIFRIFWGDREDEKVISLDHTGVTTIDIRNIAMRDCDDNLVYAIHFPFVLKKNYTVFYLEMFSVVVATKNMVSTMGYCWAPM